MSIRVSLMRLRRPSQPPPHVAYGIVLPSDALSAVMNADWSHSSKGAFDGLSVPRVPLGRILKQIFSLTLISQLLQQISLKKKNTTPHLRMFSIPGFERLSNAEVRERSITHSKPH